MDSSRDYLESWRKEKNYQTNNVHILLAVTRGQIEMEISDQEPHLNQAVLLTESAITKLNNDIGVSHIIFLCLEPYLLFSLLLFSVWENQS